MKYREFNEWTECWPIYKIVRPECIAALIIRWPELLVKWRITGVDNHAIKVMRVSQNYSLKYIDKLMKEIPKG